MEKGRADIHQSDRSGTFWHGVASIAGIQKSSQVDGNNYTISTVQKQKLHDEAYAKVRANLTLNRPGTQTLEDITVFSLTLITTNIKNHSNAKGSMTDCQ